MASLKLAASLALSRPVWIPGKYEGNVVEIWKKHGRNVVKMWKKHEEIWKKHEENVVKMRRMCGNVEETRRKCGGNVKSGGNVEET
jgi:hypothetical protein